MRLAFRKSVEPVIYRYSSNTPNVLRSDLAAVYRGPRVGGDFFDSVHAGHDRLVFVLLDIAGRREQALDIAAAVQEGLRQFVPEMFGNSDLNETDAVTELVLQLNNIILRAANGVRCAPGFVGCYNEALGMLSYINAGHLPALLRDGHNITALEASGLPLGLFSHVTHECQVCVLPSGGALLLASKGLIEVRVSGKEFGMDRLKETFGQIDSSNASDTCAAVLKGLDEFVEQQNRSLFRLLSFYSKSECDSLNTNDITAVALVRAAARASAAAR